MKNFNLVEEIVNPLFNRKEITFTIEENVIPSHKDAEEFVAKQFKTESSKFKIKKIDSKFGSNVFTIIVNIYGTSEDKDKTEVLTKQEKEAIKKAEEEKIRAAEEAKKAAEEAKKAEEEAAKVSEEPKEEAPSEEVKEEEKSE